MSTARRRRGQRGFTVIEILISLTVLLIGIVGVLTMAVSITREASFSRHTVEASVIGEDQMEKLLAVPADVLDPSGAGVDIATTAEPVNNLGVSDADGDFTRAWGLVWDTTSFGTVTVTVSWEERGAPYTLTFITQRTRL